MKCAADFCEHDAGFSLFCSAHRDVDRPKRSVMHLPEPVGALSVACPMCGAPIGQLCTGANADPIKATHWSRRQLAKAHSTQNTKTVYAELLTRVQPLRARAMGREPGGACALRSTQAAALNTDVLALCDIVAELLGHLDAKARR